MSLDVFGELNWLAIGVAAVVYYAIGAAWFAPFAMGKVWQQSIGWDPNRPAPGVTVVTIVAPLVAYLFAALATALLARATGTHDIVGAVILGIVVSMGYAGSILGVTAAFETTKPQPWTWFGVSYGYHLGGLLITALIVSLWT